MDASAFEAASIAAESWLNTCGLITSLEPTQVDVDVIYRLLMPTREAVSRRNLVDRFNDHIGTLEPLFPTLAAVSDGPVVWAHGRGRSGLARGPDAVYPHVWSSAHEAAAGVAELAIDFLTRPLEGITDPAEQRQQARRLLDRRCKALEMSIEEVAALQERIRRERAKLLQLESNRTLAERQESQPATPTPAAAPPADAAVEAPRCLLKGWHEITHALDMKHADSERVRCVNDQHGGPIINSGPGSSPMVYRDTLVQWWNRFLDQAQQRANATRDRKLSAEPQHNYGRGGTVAPEIGGTVKKPRRDKKS